jgi:hypothetical protein
MEKVKENQQDDAPGDGEGGAGDAGFSPAF